MVSEFSCCRRWVILLQFCLSDSVCFLRVLFFAVALWTRCDVVRELCVVLAPFILRPRLLRAGREKRRYLQRYGCYDPGS